MAGAAAATTSSAFPLPPPVPGNPRVSASSLPSSFRQRERRTNHLRKKILKTLENKPYPDPSSHPQFPHTIPTQETLQQHFADSEHLSSSKGPTFIDGILGEFSNKSFAKIGLYLVGAFVFQTICAVLIFGSKDLDDKDDTLNIDDGYNSEKKSKAKSKSSLLSSGNRGYAETDEGAIGSVGGVEMDNRIMEIQEMARRAREQEKMEAKRRGSGEEENDDVEDESVDRMVKKKEIDDRLTKLRKSLEGDYQKPVTKVSRKEGDVDNSSDSDSLMFKKKYKYKSPSVDSGDKPKGFGGMKDFHVANGSAVTGFSVDDGTLQTDEKNGGSLSKDGNKEQEPRASTTESIAGTSKEPIYDKQTSNLETKKPRGFGKESNDATKHDDLNKNGSLKGKKGGNKKSARNLEDKSSSQTDFWWTRIPYVMAVGMQSGGNGEESSGLFIIRNASGLHHTVAFEDRSDATNFCYLLESFFEDLNNFRTNIIPIPTNELEEEVKSQKMKVVVVKKGQLKLYVGQPLEDVESALRALIEQQSE
ncbi:hypothetical protein HanXRQr2_Chr03g0123251 [Helianthus annuus]|uniref:Uncharacterized protein n=1 Tax=Helianthus annuus TaxID=4232 RepID=A0A9K3NW11_HELAN|nr:uncharacterized protein LOC118490196 [Helianthus annuus]KAF5815452.1 hypothetical protein HanXRQr2_Chr03g0123251 [Helianthus annuus]